MISRWTNSGKENKLSQRVLDKVKPDMPLKNKICEAQKKLELQISKLNSIYEKLQKKNDFVFNKIVESQKNNNHAYAKAYAIELAEIRKMKNMVGGAKLAMEQIQLRLNTVSELGDIVVTLSPCMSVIKGLSTSLGGLMPEANASMQDLSSILGDMLSNSSVNASNDILTTGISNTSETSAILEEAHRIIEGQTKASIPDIPDELKHEIIKKESLI